MMRVGEMREFKEQQLGKVKKRQEEEKKIKKGIYQMHVLVEDECMETLSKEREKTEKKVEDVRSEEKKAAPDQRKDQKTDSQTPLERMMALGGQTSLKAKLNL